MAEKIIVPNKRLSANDVETYVDDLNDVMAAVDISITAFNLQIDAAETASAHAERFINSVPMTAIELNEALASVAQLTALDPDALIAAAEALTPDIEGLKSEQLAHGLAAVINAHNIYTVSSLRATDEAKLIYANRKITALTDEITEIKLQLSNMK